MRHLPSLRKRKVFCAKRPVTRFSSFFEIWHNSSRKLFDSALSGKIKTKKMKAYISGDENDGLSKFSEAMKKLWIQGYDCITPDVLNADGKSRKDRIKKRIHALLDCDTIYMLEGWRKSREARLEHFVALHTGIKIIKEKQQ